MQKPKRIGLVAAAVATVLVMPCGATEPADLAVEQAALAAKFTRLEALALRIAELVEIEDAERAVQLRGAVRRSRELALADRFDSVVELLEAERLAAADRDQQALAGQLGELMQLLLADPREAKAEAERQRLKELLKDVGRFIKTQRSLRDALFDGDQPDSIADRQKKLADDVEASRHRASDKEGESSTNSPGKGKQSGSQDASQGQPSARSQQGQPQPTGQQGGEPSDSKHRAQQRLAEARQAMQQAIEALQGKDPDQARADQSDAQQRLEDARREIEEALRQLREEEQVRMLTRLATRFRRMMAEQVDIYELTKASAEATPDPVDRATRVAAAGLAERERALARLADSALRLLNEDANSIAFPETVEQVRGDMRQAAGWLADVRLGRGTQQLEEDIIEQLQSAIAALEQAAAEKQQQQQPPGGQPSAGPRGDPQLVDLLAELRMVRSLQARLLRRTAMWDAMLADGEFTPDAAQESLRKLAENQDRLAAAAEELGKKMSRP